MFGGVDPSQFDPVTIAQKNEDYNYNVAVGIYNGAVDNWIQTNVQNRTLGLPLTPAPPIPQHKIYSRDANGQVTFTTRTELNPPVLPPEVAPTKAPLGTVADAYQDMQTNMLISLHNDLVLIKQKLGIS
jgi:hypothetical protein